MCVAWLAQGLAEPGSAASSTTYQVPSGLRLTPAALTRTALCKLDFQLELLLNL